MAQICEKIIDMRVFKIDSGVILGGLEIIYDLPIGFPINNMISLEWPLQ